MKLFRVRFAPSPGARWRAPAIAGSLSMLSYWIILCVYQMTARASYVVAFRQFSIVIGVVVAFMLFHEPGRFVRILGSLVITAGLVVIGVWGK